MTALAATALLIDPLGGAVCAIVLAAATAFLAMASVGRRRVSWCLACVAPLALAVHSLVPIPLWPSLATIALPRDVLARPLTELVPAPESALLLGIVLGERSGVSTELSRAFAATGTTHLLAISGFNMTLVATAVALSLRGRAGPVLRAVLAVAAIAAYSLLVGLQPSVLRAALMATVAAVGTVMGRRSATANALCAAVAFMLIADPASISDLGFQLSALATAGLVLWQASIAERLAALPTAVAQGIATTLAATAPTIPVVASAFGRISLVAPLANLVCVPLFPLLMLSGAATSAAGAIALDLARPVAFVSWIAAYVLRLAVESFASFPFASLSVPSGPFTFAIVTSLEVGVIAALRRLDRLPLLAREAMRRAVASRSPAALPQLTWSRRVAGAAFALALLPATVVTVWPSNASGTRVIALDVGQGDAYLIDAGGAVALIDGGPDPARLLDELGATLAPWQRRIDVVALTHAHTDHGAGLLAVIERYEIGLAIEPEGLNASPLTDLWSAAIAKRGIPRRAVHAGMRVALGDATIAVLAPDDDIVVDVPSLVLRVQRGAFSALFSGDAVDDAVRLLLDRPEHLRARIYVPPHHGAETPFAAALRTAARPEAALISVGAGNRYGHPTAATLAALAGVPTYRTDQDGTVEIALDGAGLVVRTHANALPPPRRGFIPYPASRQ